MSREGFLLTRLLGTWEFDKDSAKLSAMFTATRCQFQGCQFQGCPFQGCQFQGCQFQGCQFQGCHFQVCMRGMSMDWGWSEGLRVSRWPWEGVNSMV